MNKRFISILLIALLCVLSTGCSMFSSAIPELTDEQTALVVEYASDTLLKYDTKHKPKLGELVIEEPEVIEEVIEEEIIPEIVEEIPDEPEIIDNTEDISEPSDGFMSIENALGLSDELSFKYDGYEIKSSYPETLDAYFVMNASKECSLVIFEFTVTNISDHAVDVDMASKNAKFKVMVNGQTKNALTTMLVNDLSYLKQQLGPNESVTGVVVGEYLSDDLATVDTVGVILKSESGNISIKLD